MWTTKLLLCLTGLKRLNSTNSPYATRYKVDKNFEEFLQRTRPKDMFGTEEIKQNHKEGTQSINKSELNELRDKNEKLDRAVKELERKLNRVEKHEHIGIHSFLPKTNADSKFEAKLSDFRETFETELRRMQRKFETIAVNTNKTQTGTHNSIAIDSEEIEHNLDMKFREFKENTEIILREFAEKMSEAEVALGQKQNEIENKMYKDLVYVQTDLTAKINNMEGKLLENGNGKTSNVFMEGLNSKVENMQSQMKGFDSKLHEQRLLVDTLGRRLVKMEDVIETVKKTGDQSHIAGMEREVKMCLIKIAELEKQQILMLKMNHSEADFQVSVTNK